MLAKAGTCARLASHHATQAEVVAGSGCGGGVTVLRPYSSPGTCGTCLGRSAWLCMAELSKFSELKHLMARCVPACCLTPPTRSHITLAAFCNRRPTFVARVLETQPHSFSTLPSNWPMLVGDISFLCHSSSPAGLLALRSVLRLLFFHSGSKLRERSKHTY